MKYYFFLNAVILFLNLPNQLHAQSTIKVSIKVLRQQTIESKFLARTVTYDLILPNQISSTCKVLYMNDGQDFDALDLETTFKNVGQNLILVAIHTNENRLQDYGTAKLPDYKNRGKNASAYTEYLIKELKPFISKKYGVSAAPLNNFICGFSLGGLSAMDILWNHPQEFSKVGVFSGSFWWRKKAYEDGYDDFNDRIMHVLVREGNYTNGLKFWFECGTNDEKDDRNGNGIIDSIDDTQDLIKELEAKGYKMNTDIIYHEIKDGEHNQSTWKKAMPVFFRMVE